MSASEAVVENQNLTATSTIEDDVVVEDIDASSATKVEPVEKTQLVVGEDRPIPIGRIEPSDTFVDSAPSPIKFDGSMIASSQVQTFITAAATSEPAKKAGKLRRLKFQMLKKYQHGSRWFHARVLPKFSPAVQRYILTFEAYIVQIYEKYWVFMTMPESKKLIIIAMMFGTGATGFCISLFGLLTSFFILLVNVSVLLFWFVVYSYIRQQGLLKFLPPGLQNMMTQVSFFDILVGIFIERNLSKIVMAIVKPFMNASTPEEVKKTLKKEGKIPTVVYRGLFRKGIMNNFSPGMKAVMLPIKEPTLAQKLRSGVSLQDLVEKEPDTIAPISSKDLPQVGRVSDLDDWFGLEAVETSNEQQFTTRTSVHKLEKMDSAKVSTRRSNRGDSGGSEHPKNGGGDSSQEQSNVQINIAELEEKEEEQKTKINLSNLNRQYKPAVFHRQIGLRISKSQAVNLDSTRDLSSQLIFDNDNDVKVKVATVEENDESLDFSKDSFMTDKDFDEASSNNSYQAAEDDKSSLVTTYQQTGGQQGSLKSHILTVDKDGQEKLNPMQMVMLGMKDPKMLVQEVLRLPIKRLFWKTIRYRNLRRALYVFGALLAIQLKLSRRARRYTVRITVVIMFSAIYFGLLGTLAALGIKLWMHQQHKRAVLGQPTQEQERSITQSEQ